MPTDAMISSSLKCENLYKWSLMTGVVDNCDSGDTLTVTPILAPNISAKAKVSNEAETQVRWNTLVAQYYDEIYRFCVRFLGDATSGADATQNVFARSWERFESLIDDRKSRAWLYSIARHECLDRQRWWKRFSGRSAELPVEISSGAPLSDLALSVSRLLTKLPMRQREVFILRHLQGFSTEETAQMLNISAGTVKSHLKRAVDFLQAGLIG